MSERTDSREAAADDLVRLWQESTMPAPDPEALARRIARMALSRFDRVIVRRNLREYAGFAFLLVFSLWIWVAGEHRALAAAAVGGGLFVVSYLWWQHRRLLPVDPSADARTYQAALLARIDHESRLARGSRYWYLLPLYLPTLLVVVNTWQHHRLAAVIFWGGSTGVFLLVGWLTEGVGLRALQKERTRVATLYDEQEG